MKKSSKKSLSLQAFSQKHKRSQTPNKIQSVMGGTNENGDTPPTAFRVEIDGLQL